MHARLARLATAIELLCGAVAGRDGDSIYVSSKVSPQTDSKSCWRQWHSQKCELVGAPGMTVTGTFVPRNFRSQERKFHFRSRELSFPGTFVPRNFRSQERKFHRWNFRSLELSCLGTFVTWNIRSWELSFPGTFVPMTDIKGELSFPNIGYFCFMPSSPHTLCL